MVLVEGQDVVLVEGLGSKFRSTINEASLLVLNRERETDRERERVSACERCHFSIGALGGGEKHPRARKGAQGWSPGVGPEEV